MDEQKPFKDGSMTLGKEVLTPEEIYARGEREIAECRVALKAMVEGKLLKSVAWALVEALMSSDNMHQQFNMAMFSWLQSAAEEREQHEAMGKPKGSA